MTYKVRYYLQKKGGERISLTEVKLNLRWETIPAYG